MRRLIGSHLTGSTGVLTGAGSVLTAAGICPPLPGLFLTDGASFLTGAPSVLTAAEAPPCGDACTPGQTTYEGTLAAEARVASDAVATPPTYGVLEIPIGTFPDCTNFQLAISLDAKWLGFPGPAISSIYAYLNNSGMQLDHRSFTGSGAGPYPDPTAKMAGGPAADGAYHHVVMVNAIGFVDPFVDFAGPLPAQSLYFWVPVFPPTFVTGDFDIKNIAYSIVTI